MNDPILRQSVKELIHKLNWFASRLVSIESPEAQEAWEILDFAEESVGPLVGLTLNDMIPGVEEDETDE